MQLSLSEVQVEEYRDILTELIASLNKSNNGAHAKIVQNILDTLNEKDYVGVIRKLNSVEMWDGSGAVWEIYIEGIELREHFESAIIRLISLMERTKILGGGIKPIKRIFEKNRTANNVLKHLKR